MQEAFADELEPKTVEVGDFEFTVKPLSFGETSQISGKATKFDNSGQVSVDTEVTSIERLTRAIVDWNITDEDGEKVPINRENVKRLRDPISSRLLRELRGLDDLEEEEVKE